jgi:hypothetical protein
MEYGALVKLPEAPKPYKKTTQIQNNTLSVESAEKKETSSDQDDEPQVLT